jgi:hypothetical protein
MTIMKTFLAIVILLLTVGYGRSQELSGTAAMEARSEEKGDKTYVHYFKPRVIDHEWSVVLATVKTLTPETKDPMVIEQYGTVTLSIHKVLYGKPISEITLPYGYDNLAVFKGRDPAIRKRYAHTLLYGPDEFGWPDLKNLKKQYLLVVINPHAIDLDVVASDKPQTLAAKVFETSGEDDPRVVELLKEIPK